jgi:hypothetical protein
MAYFSGLQCSGIFDYLNRFGVFSFNVEIKITKGQYLHTTLAIVFANAEQYSVYGKVAWLPKRRCFRQFLLREYLQIRSVRRFHAIREAVRQERFLILSKLTGTDILFRAWHHLSTIFNPV